jgi:hypothetical protein
MRRSGGSKRCGRRLASEKASERIAALVAGGDALVVERDRFAERDAEDAVTACRAARDLCKAALSDAEASLGYKRLRVDAAVRPIMAAEVGSVCSEAEALKRQLDGKLAVLTLLESALEPGSPERTHVDNALRSRAPDYREHPATEQWVAWRMALLADPNAQLRKE